MGSSRACRLRDRGRRLPRGARGRIARMTPMDFGGWRSASRRAESAHMNHPDFRARGKIFATLGYPDDSWGMVTRRSIRAVHQADETFSPVKGAWGKGGATRVQLRTARKALLSRAFDCAMRATLAAQAGRPRGGRRRILVATCPVSARLESPLPCGPDSGSSAILPAAVRRNSVRGVLPSKVFVHSR